MIVATVWASGGHMYVYNWLLHGYCNLLMESSTLLHLTETFLVACIINILVHICNCNDAQVYYVVIIC